MAMQPKKDFSKRPLRPPALRASTVSYSEALSARGEISVRNNTEGIIPGTNISCIGITKFHAYEGPSG